MSQVDRSCVYFLQGSVVWGIGRAGASEWHMASLSWRYTWSICQWQCLHACYQLFTQLCYYTCRIMLSNSSLGGRVRDLPKRERESGYFSGTSEGPGLHVDTLPQRAVEQSQFTLQYDHLVTVRWYEVSCNTLGMCYNIAEINYTTPITHV